MLHLNIYLEPNTITQKIIMKNTIKTLLTLLLISFFSLAHAQTDSEQTKQTRISSNGLYHVTIESFLKPLKLGRMHAWTANIRTADDKPVTDASIKVAGGMPIHNHGFPTHLK